MSGRDSNDFDDVIQNLNGKIKALESKYMGFVSYCSSVLEQSHSQLGKLESSFVEENGSIASHRQMLRDLNHEKDRLEQDLKYMMTLQEGFNRDQGEENFAHISETISNAHSQILTLIKGHPEEYTRSREVLNIFTSLTNRIWDMWMATVTNGNSNETNQKLTHLLHLTNETKKIENEHKQCQARQKNTAEAQLAQARNEIEFLKHENAALSANIQRISLQSKQSSPSKDLNQLSPIASQPSNDTYWKEKFECTSSELEQAAYELQQLVEENERIEAHRSHLETKLSSLFNEIAAEKRATELNEQMLQQTFNEINDQQERVFSVLHSKIEDLSERMKHLSVFKNQFKSQRQLGNRQVSELLHTNQQLEYRVQSQKLKYAELEMKQNTVDEDLKTKLLHVQELNNSFSEKIADMNALIQKQNQIIAKQRANEKSHLAEIENFRNEIEKWGKQKSDKINSLKREFQQEKGAYEDQITQLQSEIQHLKDDISDLQESNDRGLKDENSKLQSNISNIKGELASIQNKFKDEEKLLQERICELEDELQAQKLISRNAEISNNELRLGKEKLIAQNAHLKNIQQSLKIKYKRKVIVKAEALNKEILRLEIENNDKSETSNSEIKYLQEQNKILNEKIPMLQAQIQENESQYRMELTTASQDNQSNLDTLANANMEIQTLKSKLAASNSDNLALRETHERRQDEYKQTIVASHQESEASANQLDKLTEQYTGAMERVTILQKRVNVQREETQQREDQLRSQLEQYEQKYEASQRQVSNLNEKISYLEGEVAEQATLQNDKNDALSQVEGTVSQLNQAMENTQEENNQLSSNLNQALDQIQTLTEELESQYTTKIDLEEKIQSLESELKEKQAQDADMQTTLTDLEARVEKNKSKYEKSRIENDELQQETQQMKESYEEAFNQMTQHLQKAKEEIKQINMTHDDYITKMEANHEVQVIESTDQLTKLANKNSQQRSDIETLQAQLNSIEKELLRGQTEQKQRMKLENELELSKKSTEKMIEAAKVETDEIVERLQSEKIILEENIEDLGNKVLTLQEEANEVSENHFKETKKLEKTIKNQLDALNAAQTENSQMSNKLSLQASNNEAKVADLETKGEQLQDTLDAEQQTNKQLAQIINEMSSKADIMVKDIADQAAMEQLQEENARLGAKAKEHDLLLSSQESLMDSLRKQVKVAKEKIGRLKEEVSGKEDLIVKCQQAYDRNDELTSQLHEMSMIIKKRAKSPEKSELLQAQEDINILQDKLAKSENNLQKQIDKITKVEQKELSQDLKIETLQNELEIKESNVRELENALQEVSKNMISQERAAAEFGEIRNVLSNIINEDSVLTWVRKLAKQQNENSPQTVLQKDQSIPKLSIDQIKLRASIESPTRTVSQRSPKSSSRTLENALNALKSAQLSDNENNAFSPDLSMEERSMSDIEDSLFNASDKEEYSEEFSVSERKSSQIITHELEDYISSPQISGSENRIQFGNSDISDF